MTTRLPFPFALLACLAILTWAVPPAAGQSANPPTPSQQPADGPALAQGAGPHDGAADRARTDMRRIVLRLEAEIDELERLRQWQKRLLEAARIDPAGAARQRRPIAACRQSVLTHWCSDLIGMFIPGTEAQP